MITAVHTLIYSDDPEATRTFFRDVLELPFVTDPASGPEDAPAGDAAAWLIFATGPSELGVHPTSSEFEGEVVKAPRHHQISLMVEDIAAAEATLRERGARITSGPSDMGFGVGLEVEVPGADGILVYQPKHATAYNA
jgi:catechol 2,3-dioxygenase-like lactoylglutathione lyase family enzyme